MVSATVRAHRCGAVVVVVAMVAVGVAVLVVVCAGLVVAQLLRNTAPPIRRLTYARRHTRPPFGVLTEGAAPAAGGQFQVPAANDAKELPPADAMLARGSSGDGRQLVVDVADSSTDDCSPASHTSRTPPAVSASFPQALQASQYVG